MIKISYIFFILIFVAVILCSCSKNVQNDSNSEIIISESDKAKNTENTIFKTDMTAIKTEECSKEEQITILPSNEKQITKYPIEKRGENLELPSAFPSHIISIVEGANITDVYEDGVSLSITYKTGKSFEELVELYKQSMKNAKLIMEDKLWGNYYTINGTKDEYNIFIVVFKFLPGNNIVTINTNTSDLTAVDENKKLRDEWANISNKADFTPMVIIDPVTYEPPPLGINVENQTIKAVTDGMVINIFVYENPADFDLIANDVIFKQKIFSNDAESPYRDGDNIPVIYNLVDGSIEKSNLVIKGMVEYKGIKYSIAEQIYTIKLSYDFEYAPGSDKVKIQVYTPHKGDEYWFVVWNSREIYTLNMPKYLIQAEGLDKLTEDIYKGE